MTQKGRGVSIRDAVWAALTIVLAVYALDEEAWMLSIPIILVGILHAITAGLFLIRRPPMKVELKFGTVATTVIGVVYVYFFEFEPLPYGNQTIGEVLLTGGMLACIAATVTLGRSFGVFPAMRGLRTEGLYGLVRHPIYSSYLLMDAGILCSAPTKWNFGVALVGLAATLIRMWREEALLRTAAEYASYAERVRYRLIPGLV